MKIIEVGRKFIFLIAFVMLFTSVCAEAKPAKKATTKKPAQIVTPAPVVLEPKEETSFSQRVLQSTNNELLALNENEQGGFIKAPTEEVFEKPQTTFFGELKQTVKDIYELEIEQTDAPVPLLKDKLTFNFEKGPLDNLHIWNANQMHFMNTLPERGHNSSMFNMAVINVIFDGQFKGKKEGFRIMLEPSHHPGHSNFMQTFFQDFYLESTRIPHTKLQLGNSRPMVGIEGGQSPYTLDFINRAQIARKLSNARKLGFRVKGDYSLMDYDTGIYSSGTNFSDFFPGYEYDAWMNLKPLGKTDGKWGKPTIGAGIQSGEKHGMSYYYTGAYAGYEYKKFKTKFEYARANGSNGSAGLTDARSQGFFWTNIYKVTPKLELLTRFDQFDSDRYVRNNNSREYTFGTNYYIKGQALKLIFNYVYCQNDSLPDSHKLMIGTQIIL